MHQNRSTHNTQTLTNREVDVLRLMDAGQSNRSIAEQLTLSYNTVTWYVRQIFNKLGVNRRTQAVAVARSLGILDDDRKVERQELSQTLTDREMEVLALIDAGLSNKAIADHLVLSYNTVAGYVQQIFKKLGVNRRTQAVAEARSIGLLDRVLEDRSRFGAGHQLPIQSTPFIGREQELAELDQLLRDPDVRLVTVLGTGGIGKTRLALKAGKNGLDLFPDGVFFVPLARLQSKELIVPSIIQALGIEFAGGDAVDDKSPMDLKEILLKNIRRKQMLLILDNFEHLLDGVDLVSEFIQTASEIKILATSRSRLKIGGEHRFQVVGMAYPEDIEDKEAQRFSAVRLFLESARRARSSFEAHPDEMKHITTICRLVEGMPLGIRLAAAWVETLSPEEIAAEIAQNLDLLESDLSGVPERHRSIRALYDHTWKLLSEREQNVFQGFSVFRGGCSRDAAQAITGATLRNLRSLVDKSLLHRTMDGRYEIHELSREYAAEKLLKSSDAWASKHELHSVYYTNLMRIMGENLKSERQTTTLMEMDLEIENLHAAWHWALTQLRFDLLDQSMEGFRYYYDIRRREQEAKTLFHQAVEHLKVGATKDEQRVYAILLCMQGYFTDGIEQKQELYRQSLSIIEKLDESGRDVRYQKGLVQNFSGRVVISSDFDEAIRFQESCLRLFQELNNRYWIAEALKDKGRAYYFIGDLDKAQKIFERSLAIFQTLGDPRRIARILNLLDFVARYRGDFEEAERLARKILTIYKKIGDPLAVADGTANLGVVLIILGKFQEAHAHLEKASNVHREFDDCMRFLSDIQQLCWTKILLGWYSQVWDEMQSAMDLCYGRIIEIDEGYIKGGALSVQGAASLALGKLTEAELLLQESIAAYQNTHATTMSVHPYSTLGIVYINLGQLNRAREYLHRALEIGAEINSAMAHLYALTGVALLLAEQGNLICAIEIFALTMRYPWMANARDTYDMVGQPLSLFMESLPADIIVNAQKRGRERDLEKTVQELLVELA